jgi:hypothetical protein
MSASRYGEQEVNGLSDLGISPKQWGEHLSKMDPIPVCWTEPGLKITRLRLVSDPGFPVWDVSYCHGVMPDGRHVQVDLPFSQVPKRDRAKFLVREAIRAGVYAKGIGILDNISTLQ